MKLKTVEVEYGRVVNLGEYNSLRASCKLAAEVDDDEDTDAVLGALWDQARESVRAQVMRVVKRADRHADEVTGSDGADGRGSELPPVHEGAGGSDPDGPSELPGNPHPT